MLTVKNLCKHFGGIEAVKSLDFQLQGGEILGLVGPNGSGKSTTFNLITGFHRPDEGTVLFKGEDITGLQPYHICRKGIGRTFQLVKPLGKMSILQNIMIGAFARTNSVDVARNRALEQLEMTGLLHKKDLFPGELTYADRKRLELTRALATTPNLLLLDEIAAGLNPAETQEIIRLIEEIRRTGIAMIVVEHVMDFIMSISDRLMVLNYGIKIAEGLSEEVVHNPTVIDAYLGEDYATGQ